MPKSSANKSLHRWPVLWRVLAWSLCLVLLLAGGIHTAHAAGADVVSHPVEVAGADGACDACSSAHLHGIGANCSLVPGCAMSAALAGTSSLCAPPTAAVGPGDDQLHRGIETLPNPRPPKLSAHA